MRLMSRSPVRHDDVDSLGHVNFSTYTLRALSAQKRLLEAAGLGPAALAEAGLAAFQQDLLSRFHKEQFDGVTLETWGALCEAGPDGATAAYRICNAETGETAATFLYRTAFA